MIFYSKTQTIIAIGATLIGGYAFMHGAAYVLPIRFNNPGVLLFTLLLIAFGLSIPYAVLKVLLRHEHSVDADEQEIALRDIPKEGEMLHYR